MVGDREEVQLRLIPGVLVGLLGVPRPIGVAGVSVQVAPVEVVGVPHGHRHLGHGDMLVSPPGEVVVAIPAIIHATGSRENDQGLAAVAQR